MLLPSPDQYTVAVRFCPILYKLHEHDDNTAPVIDLPYRMIFAVATKSSVCLYDTQQPTPIGIISNIHYTRLTDLAWSQDGRILIVSSTDGFCTLITFAADELGVEYRSDEVKEKIGPIVDEPKTNNGVLSTVEMKSETTIVAQTQLIVVKTPEKVIALEIPDGIISTKDRFDSPEITSNKPATPISFRRAPRNTDTETETKGSSPGGPATVNAVHLNGAAAAAEVTVKSSTKAAIPIAVRRHQRKILPDSVVPVMNQSATEDEAMDAWPIDQPRPRTETVVSNVITQISHTDEAADPVVKTDVPRMEIDETEDMRLVYDDDSQAEDETVITATKSDIQTDSTPNTKVPRRVELRTISTPKAKKKLL